MESAARFDQKLVCELPRRQHADTFVPRNCTKVFVAADYNFRAGGEGASEEFVVIRVVTYVLQ